MSRDLGRRPTNTSGQILYPLISAVFVHGRSSLQRLCHKIQTVRQVLRSSRKVPAGYECVPMVMYFMAGGVRYCNTLQTAGPGTRSASPQLNDKPGSEAS